MYNNNVHFILQLMSESIELCEHRQYPCWVCNPPKHTFPSKESVIAFNHICEQRPVLLLDGYGRASSLEPASKESLVNACMRLTLERDAAYNTLGVAMKEIDTLKKTPPKECRKCREVDLAAYQVGQLQDMLRENQAEMRKLKEENCKMKKLNDMFAETIRRLKTNECSSSVVE